MAGPRGVVIVEEAGDRLVDHRIRLIVKAFVGGDEVAGDPTPAEARHYANPDAVAALNRALEAANAGDTHTYTLRTGDQGD